MTAKSRSEDSDEAASPWLNIQAVVWVLDRAPDVPASLVATLIGLARHVPDGGKITFPSQGTLARYTRKTVRQVKKDLAALVEKGLIKVAEDQGAASVLRADRRPVVYELVMPNYRPHGVDSTTGRQVPPGTSRHVVKGRTGGTTGSRGVNSSSPEESLKNQEETSSRARADVIVARACPDATEDEIKGLLEELKGEATSSLIGYVSTLAAKGDLADRLTALRSAAVREQIADQLEQARRDRRMECEHGTPAGRFLRPDTRQSATCGQCRAGHTPARSA
ncbi:helix-turn-helix domain-containing protein [Amycolatopsis sp. NPDC051716]|uniref:helix-turn-helix domain-containing protein n=1 Tax=Amycolatopsis sp. NPDC051716 TaxID=3155804 RepID=UPI00341BDB56